MDDLNIQIAQARTQYETYRHELQQLVDEADQLRLQLFQVLKNALRKLERRLQRRPGKPTSSYWRQYEDYWQAFVLFKERMTQTYGLFHQEHVIPSPFDRTPHDDELDEWIDEIEIVLSSLRSRRHQQQDLLTVIDILDSIQRLRALKIPAPAGNAGSEIYEALTAIKLEIKRIEESISQTLDEVGIVRINLQPGQYPPPETTRIVGRREAEQGEAVSIAEIILIGYLWQDKLLRKADIIVTALKESN
jgi:regulator of replication initiation timing